MTLHRARQLEWLVMALAVLALGLGADYSQPESRTMIASLQELLLDPLTGALLWTAGAFAMSALHHRAASLLCTGAGFAWAAVGVLQTVATLDPRPGSAPADVAAAAVFCVTLGVLLQQLVAKRLLGFLASAASLAIAAVAGVAALVADELGSAGIDRFSATVPALAAAALSGIGLRQLLRSQTAPLDTALNRLVAPIAIAGSVGALLCGELIAHNSSAGYAKQLGWMAAASTLALILTLASLTILKLVAEVVVVRRSRTKWQRLLRRQREIMHERTAALRRSRAHYQDLFASVPAPVILTSPSGAILAANPAMLQLLGAESEEQVRAINMASFHADPEQRRKLVADWTASDASIHQGEFKLRRLDGEERSALFTSHVVKAPRAAEIDHIQGTFTDITELRRAEANQRRLESNLRLSQKLESVGRLAAGIAHEINTPMQYIGDNMYFLRESFEALRHLLESQRGLLEDVAGRGAVELADELRQLDSDADVDGILAAMPGALSRTDDGVKSVNRIVAAMKELAHPGEGAKTSTDVNAVINTAVTVTRNAHKTVAKINLDLGAIPHALAYKNELCQVLINLIVNASHAIESAQKIDRRAGAIVIQTRTEGAAIRIDVSDNGCGIPDSVIDKIFDPFFTTKEVGKGTGQGLALARTTIVEKHGGHIAVQSAVGQGSTFTITLPIGNHDSTMTPEIP
jgi:PAS domain S-box-containing protein